MSKFAIFDLEEDAGFFKCETCSIILNTKFEFEIHSALCDETLTVPIKIGKEEIITLNQSNAASSCLNAENGQHELDLMTNNHDKGEETDVSHSNLERLETTDAKLKSQKNVICDKLLGNKSPINIVDHLKETHQCQTCEKIFSNPTKLREHDNAAHEKLRPYQCQICKTNLNFKKSQDHFSASNAKCHLVIKMPYTLT